MGKKKHLYTCIWTVECCWAKSHSWEDFHHNKFAVTSLNGPSVSLRSDPSPALQNDHFTFSSPTQASDSLLSEANLPFCLIKKGGK